MSIMTPGRWPRPQLMITGAGTLVLVAASLVAASMYFSAPEAGRTGLGKKQPGRSIVASLPPPDLLRPISPEEALKENAERAFSTRADSPATGFRLKTDMASSGRAQECLAQAVYYEAATEGADGQRAVAQIVLNRMRHPGYPASVCGVVYQGSERSTGCQFSFTCDGSLARIPSAWAWKQANNIARAALRGAVFAPVGHASHYHADYVLPYWADSLDKVAQIGRHIFYRFKGSLGSARAFSQSHKGSEPAIPTPAPLVLTADLPGDTGLVAPPIQDPGGLEAFAGELVSSATTEAPLADAKAGTLLTDGAEPSGRATSSKAPEKPSCQSTDDSRRLKPMGTSDMQSGARGC